MIGLGREELEESYLGEIKLDSRPEAPVVLETKGLTLAPAYREVSFAARAGEVLGIYGFMGCGQLELARTLFGRLRADSGALEIGGRAVALANTTAAKQAGIAYVAESRRAMLFGEEPVYKNVSIAVLERLSRWLLKPERERAIARDSGEEPRHPPAAASRRASAGLSGGNQQKVALAKWLTHPPRILLLAEPTRGMDVGAKEDVVKIVRALARSGHCDRRLLDRAGDRSFARRPRPGDAQGRDRPRIRRRGDQQGPPAGGGLRIGALKR